MYFGDKTCKSGKAKETSYIPCIIKTVRIESEGIVLAKMLILSIPEEEETLIDKIMAVVNSTQDEQGTELRKNVSVIHIGTLEINMTQHSVYKDGKEILLTNTEFKMLYYLASNKGMALSKDQIYNYIWNGEYALDDRNITSHIRRLRVKIEDDPAQPQYIQTVRGIGYRMGK